MKEQTNKQTNQYISNHIHTYMVAAFGPTWAGRKLPRGGWLDFMNFMFFLAEMSSTKRNVSLRLSFFVCNGLCRGTIVKQEMFCMLQIFRKKRVQWLLFGRNCPAQNVLYAESFQEQMCAMASVGAELSSPNSLHAW